jgi:hypothetical protein
MVRETPGARDRRVFVMSGHGNGDKTGNSYLCLLPDPVRGTTPDEKAGRYPDVDIAADLADATGGAATTFVFLDACLSGGIIAEILDALPRVVGTTTATRAGFGYDSSATQSGAWTSTFLVKGLMAPGLSHRNVDLSQHFTACHDAYVGLYRNPADQPCFFGRTHDERWNTEEDPHATLPAGTFMANDWL